MNLTLSVVNEKRLIQVSKHSLPDM